MDHYAEETFSLIGVAPELLYIHYMGHKAETKFCPFEEKYYSPILGLVSTVKGNKGNQSRCLAWMSIFNPADNFNQTGQSIHRK